MTFEINDLDFQRSLLTLKIATSVMFSSVISISEAETRRIDA